MPDNKIRRQTAINQRIGALNQFSRSRKIDGSYELVSVSAWQCRGTSGRKGVEEIIPCKLDVDPGFDQKFVEIYAECGI